MKSLKDGVWHLTYAIRVKVLLGRRFTISHVMKLKSGEPEI
jgi:hypothetical protein